jgi:DNA mismatch endonuclease, patch repair protein
MDTLTPEERSKRMSLVRGRDSKPEMRVRRLVHALGYRYRLHRRDLPGSPDLVFGPRRKVIFVHGCFWHQHPDPACKLARLPKTRQDFWQPKLARNRERDERINAALTSMGWSVLEVWECKTADTGKLRETIRGFLG